MAAPQALTPEQIQQIIAAGRGNTVNLNGTIYQGNYADTGSGETFQEGALQDIYGYTPEQNKVGGTYNQYDPTGAFSRTGTQQEVNATEDFIKFLAGAGLTFALPGALSGSLFGGAGAAEIGNGAFLGEGVPSGVGAWDAAFTGAGGAFNPAFALGADGLVGTALPTTTLPAATSGLTAAQIANLARAGINVAGLLGATNAISNMGGGNTSTATPVTYSGGGAGGYSPEYFSQLQSNYNSLMPNVPRDVASPLQNWYSTEFNPGASVTGSLFGDMVGGTSGGMAPNTGVKPVTPPVVRPPIVPPVVPPTTVIANSPLYTSLTKTSTPTDVAKAYADFIAKAGGNTTANRKAATDYLTNLGLTQGQIESSYSAYLDTLPAAGNTYQQLNAKANVDNVVQSYKTFIENAGGNTAANRELATNYLKDIGVSDTLINQAYTTYLGGLPAAGNTYQQLNANATPKNVAEAYSSFVGGAGGDTAANQATAINYLKDIGLSDDQINQAYSTYLTGANTGGSGMLSGGASTTGTAAAPSYTNLAASSSPQSIAAAYADFIASAGGDTPANQQAAIDYLTGLGVSQDTINSAYGLFTGA
jgi:hypothetical protein